MESFRPRHAVVVPVKPASIAKSRLSDLGDEVRRELVVAFAADTVTAALESPAVAAVMVVTDDHLLAAALTDLGVHVIPDGVSGDLNGTLVQAAAESHRRWPDCMLAALCADLPALKTSDLTLVLESASGSRPSFVADAAGVGTTLLMAPSVESFEPHFGVRSREAHLGSGAVELSGIDVTSLRRDVDTAADLALALELGVGARTALVTGGLRL